MTASKVAPLVWSLAQTCACERVRFSPLHNAPETAGKAHVICVGTPRGVGCRARASPEAPVEVSDSTGRLRGPRGPAQTGWLVGPLAQTVERRHHTPRVTGSIPVRSTMR